MTEKHNTTLSTACPNCHASLPNGHTATENGTIKSNEGVSKSPEKTKKWTEELNCLCSCKNGKRKSQAATHGSAEGGDKSDRNGNVIVNVKEAQHQELVKVTKQHNRLLEKSYTLPTKLNGLKRNQRHLFSGKMEVLDENDKPLDVLGENPCEVKCPGNVRKKKVTTDKSEMKLPHIATQQTSPRYLMAVCPNHNGRSGSETLEAVLYCAACVQSVCYKCAFEKHKDHQVSPIPVAAESIRVNLAERKRKIENTISQMRAKRKSVETSNEEALQRIHSQFEQVILRIRKKEEEIASELNKLKQKRINLVYGVQSQQETTWGQIDAVLKTKDDVKMLQEYTGLTIIDFKDPMASECTKTSPREGDNGLTLHGSVPKPSLDLNAVQDEIEKIRLNGCEVESTFDGNDAIISNGITPRQIKKRFSFKLDANTAHQALRVASNYSSVEYVGSERNISISLRQSIPGSMANLPGGNPYQSKVPGFGGLNGINGLGGRHKRAQFATVLGDASITQGKQYWEVSVNRSMEYRLGVAYKQMQGTRTLADEHNSWALSLTYPDRFSAIHKHHKEYIFVPNHAASHANKVIRIGIFLDYERGVLSFYNASTAAEKRHLYTFRTFFNRPVWPLLSLRQGKLQILTGLPVPRNLVWKTR